MATRKQTSKKATQKPAATPRKLKTQKYKSFRLEKRIKPTAPKLPSAFTLLKNALGILKSNWRLFAGITLVYVLLNLLFVRGLSNTLQLTELKLAINEGFTGNFKQLSTGVAVFGYMLGSSGASLTEIGATYQSLLVVFYSLAVIWALRKVYAKSRVTVKESYYRSTYPLFPFVLVVFVIGLQLIPLFVGNSVYATVVNNGLAVTAPERVAWALMYFLFALLSIYMVCSSIFALYIVTLSNMTPMKALRSARQLVLHRRWAVLRKVLFLPVVLLIFSGIGVVPLIIFATAFAEWGFFVLSTISLLIVHSYVYGLYRELL